MKESELIIKDDRGVRHLILNRPAKLNAIDYSQHLRLLHAFTEAQKDEHVKVIALSGMGRGFCAGDDLTAKKFQGEDPFAHRQVDLEMGSGPSLLLYCCRVLRNLPKPTVALMHNIALGSGYDYSLSCDFRVVTENIRYGDPRIDRALWAAEGWSYKLPRLTNQSTVTEIAYLGQLMNGKRALDLGLAHLVLDDHADIREGSRVFLDRLIGQSGIAYGQVKQSILSSLDSTFGQSQLSSVGAFN